MFDFIHNFTLSGSQVSPAWFDGYRIHAGDLWRTHTGDKHISIFFYKINIFVYFEFCHYLTLISFGGFYNTFLIYKKCQFFFSTILNSVFLNKWQLTICQSITFCGFLLICHSMTCGNWQLECGNPHLCHLVSEIHEIHTL